MFDKKIVLFFAVFLFFVQLAFADSLFAGIHFETCLDANCLFPQTMFERADNIAYVVAFDTEGAALSGVLTKPDNSTSVVSFDGNTARISLGSLSFGSYSLEITATKAGYEPYSETISFELVDKRRSVFDGLFFETCLDSNCAQPENVFEPGEQAFLKAISGTLGVFASGTVSKDDGAQVSFSSKGAYCDSFDGTVAVRGSACASAQCSVFEKWCFGADLDRSGSVTATDYVNLKREFGRTDCYYSNNWCNGADITQDNKVEVADLLFLERNWNTGCGLPEQKLLDCFSVSDVAEIPLDGIGEYTLIATASKQGFYDYNELIVFSVVEDRNEPQAVNDFNDLYFIVSEYPTATTGNAFFNSSSSSLFVKAFNTEGATLSGTLFFPWGSSQPLSFSSNIASVPRNDPGTYTVDVIVSKPGYIPAEKTFYYTVVYGLSGVTTLIQTCNNNGVCDSRETHYNCWKDCPVSTVFQTCLAADVDGSGTVDNLDVWYVEMSKGHFDYCGYEDVDSDNDTDDADVAAVRAALGSTTGALCTRRVLDCRNDVNGLLAFYKFEDDFSSGNRIIDSSGRGNHAVPVGGAHFRFDGVSGRSATFGSTGASIGVPWVAGILGKQNFTFSTWVKSSNLIGSVDPIYAADLVGTGVFDGNHYFGYIGFYSTVLSLWYNLPGFDSDGGYPECSVYVAADASALPVADGNWHHFAVTDSNGSVAFYFDGTQLPLIGDSYKYGECYYDKVSSLRVNIGGQYQPYSPSFPGSLDELMLFDRALTPSEITDIAQQNPGDQIVGIVRSCGALLNEPGTYVLESDITGEALAGPCITIGTQYVSLDCQGYSIASQSAVAGVYSEHPYSTIRNCTIRMGPGGYSSGADAIIFSGADNSVITDNNLSNNYRGIMVYSSKKVLISGNIVNNNATEGISAIDRTGDSIEDCAELSLLNNFFKGNGYTGILLSDCPRTVLKGNFVSNAGLYSGTNFSSKDSAILNNIFYSNNQDGLAIATGNTNVWVSGNIACSNNRKDMACYGSAFGSLNIFSSTVPCGDWPAASDFTACDSNAVLFISNYGRRNCGANACDGTDLDFDGDVDVDDLGLFVQYPVIGPRAGASELEITGLAVSPSSIVVGNADIGTIVRLQNNTASALSVEVDFVVRNSGGGVLFSDSKLVDVAANSAKVQNFSFAVDAGWGQGTYSVNAVGVSGALRAEKTTNLAILGSGLSVPEIGLFLVPLILLAVFFVLLTGKYGKGKKIRDLFSGFFLPNKKNRGKKRARKK